MWGSSCCACCPHSATKYKTGVAALLAAMFTAAAVCTDSVTLTRGNADRKRAGMGMGARKSGGMLRGSKAATGDKGQHGAMRDGQQSSCVNFNYCQSVDLLEQAQPGWRQLTLSAPRHPAAAASPQGAPCGQMTTTRQPSACPPVGREAGRQEPTVAQWSALASACSMFSLSAESCRSTVLHLPAGLLRSALNHPRPPCGCCKPSFRRSFGSCWISYLHIHTQACY